MTQIIPVLTLDGRFLGNIVNELSRPRPLVGEQCGRGVAPAPAANLSNSPSGRVGCVGENVSSLPVLSDASVFRSFHEA